jgi:hypothetical protein
MNYKDFDNYINAMTDDWFDSNEAGLNDLEDYMDYVHECADGSEFVIYYSKAWDLVTMIRDFNSDLYNDAESYAFDLFESFDSADHMMTIIAYGAIYTALSVAIQNRIDS